MWPGCRACGRCASGQRGWTGSPPFQTTPSCSWASGPAPRCCAATVALGLDCVFFNGSGVRLLTGPQLACIICKGLCWLVRSRLLCFLCSLFMLSFSAHRPLGRHQGAVLPWMQIVEMFPICEKRAVVAVLSRHCFPVMHLLYTVRYSYSPCICCIPYGTRHWPKPHEQDMGQQTQTWGFGQ